MYDGCTVKASQGNPAVEGVLCLVCSCPLNVGAHVATKVISYVGGP